MIVFLLFIGFLVVLLVVQLGAIGGLTGLVGCGEHAYVSEPGRAWMMGPVRCRLRVGHKGDHFYGDNLDVVL